MYKKLTLAMTVLSLLLFTFEARAQEATAQSDDALAYLNVDIENNPGWVAAIKGGYQWKLFRDVGMRVSDAGGTVASRSHGITRSGGTGSVSLGYNFGNRIPLTIGVIFSHGPSGKLNSYATDAAGIAYHSYQKVRIYTFDFSADYDFRNCSRWTPFVGLTAGLGFVSHHGNGSSNNGGVMSYNGYSKKRQTNFVIGARAGTKYKINDCITLSLYGSYNYLGKVRSKSYDLADVRVRTNKMKVHSLDLKVGLKILF